MGSTKFSTAEKAAIVLMTIGEDAAAEVLKQLPATEVKRILSAAARMGRIDQLTSDDIMTEFAETMLTMKKGLEGSPQAAAKFLNQFSRMRGLDLNPSSIIDFATPALKGTLAGIDSRALANFLTGEHPQVTAVVLVHLEPTRMAAVLKTFTATVKTEIILRIARLESVEPELINEVEETIRKEFSRAGTRTARLGGVEKLAATMNAMRQDDAEIFLADLEERDPDLAESIRASMFTFKDLLKIDARSLPKILNSVSAADLKAALRGAEVAVRTHVFSAMSDRAATQLAEDIEAGGKIPLTVVQEARSLIAANARALLASGDIYLVDDLPTGSRSA